MNIFIFHRDLRIEDNVGLHKLASKTKEIYLFFIFNKKQLEKNDYFSNHSFNFMINSLKNLNRKAKINFFLAKDEVTLFENIIKNNKIERIYTNTDYTSFAIERWKKLKYFCNKNNIEFKTFQDYLLIEPGKYSAKVFTPFWNKVIKELETGFPKILKPINFKSQSFENDNSITLKHFSPQKTTMPLTRNEVLNAIKKIDKSYADKRDILGVEATSKIGTSIKYGIISIRELLFYSKKHFKNIDNAFTRQTIWREFFYHSHLNSKRKSFSTPLLVRYNDFPWKKDKKLFKAWCMGKTGYPIVDAAMNELNKTGYMHNRARMITASFLTKNLLIDWRWGEKYFATKLIDYDPIVNNCSWQWVAGCGYEANPFYRIFNPYLQDQKFDFDNSYKNKYLPRDYDSVEIIDYKKSRKNALETFKKYFVV